jgi:hypothetical protein
MWTDEIKKEAMRLRALGNTYKEVRIALGESIPKGTMSGWCSGLILSAQAKDALFTKWHPRNVFALEQARLALKRIRDHEKARLTIELAPLVLRLEEFDVGKIALAMLYFGEGFKKNTGTLGFGNSSPEMISLYLHLLRRCYKLDESKFRCTVQCRADQPQKRLETFWCEVTRIPSSQFYPTRVDPRTVGKPTLRPGYFGVCRIDYFSANLLNEVILLIELLSAGR